LETLRKSGRRLFVATSKNEADARRILDHFGLAKYFAEIYGARNDGGRAIKSELLTYLLGRERIDPAAVNVVMVGDRKYDVLGAKAVGLKAAGVLWGYGSAAELSEAGADALIAAPSQLADTVAKLNQAAG
jgi:phosphoglycolate phosphatase